MRVAAVVAALVIILAPHPLIQSYTEYVHNELSGKKLIVHCRSEDDDIGAQMVDVGSDLHWDFYGGDRTLFWCKVAVEDRRLSFDAYTNSDGSICCRDIHWSVRDDGLHLLDPDGQELTSHRRGWNHL
ncbi:unnamed protein product [Linum trigynum]|uniref:S-protein homolog n=1 Tax=Linum trigynum TaxID=586398 RepID=A0AAV2D1Y2_9ROSI